MFESLSEFKDSIKEGFGYFYKPGKYVYEGNFLNNLKNGKGLINLEKG